MRRTLHHGSVVDLGIETAVLPDGRTVDLEIVRHPGGAAVVAYEPARGVCLLRQFRHAGGGWLWELPAGKIDPGETPLTTAQRELEEEAGLRARDWQPLTRFLSTPGFCDEVIHVFLARGLEDCAANPQAHECIEIHWRPMAEALAMADRGEICDAKTLLGLLYAAKVCVNAD